MQRSAGEAAAEGGVDLRQAERQWRAAVVGKAGLDPVQRLPQPAEAFGWILGRYGSGAGGHAASSGRSQ